MEVDCFVSFPFLYVFISWNSLSNRTLRMFSFVCILLVNASILNLAFRQTFYQSPSIEWKTNKLTTTYVCFDNQLRVCYDHRHEFTFVFVMSIYICPVFNVFASVIYHINKTFFNLWQSLKQRHCYSETYSRNNKIDGNNFGMIDVFRQCFWQLYR